MSATARRLRRKIDPMAQKSAAAKRIVNRASADELHAKLVNDAAGGHATDMMFMLPALKKIAKARGIPLDAAFTQFRDEAKQKRGGLGLPL